MKPFNLTQFRKHFNIWKWEHPDIKQSFWTKEDRHWDHASNAQVTRTYTLSTLRYKDDRITQLYTNDDGNHYRKLDVYQNHTDTAKLLGLITSMNYRATCDCLLDALYYVANPPQYFNKNGTLKKGFWGMLSRRIRSHSIRYSWVTEHMLQQAIQLIPENVVNDLSLLQDYLNNYNIHSYYWYQDYHTKKIHVKGSDIRVKIGNSGWVYIHYKTVDILRANGYRLDERNDIWLSQDQFCYDGQIWNRSEINIVECRTCGEEIIDQMTHEGVCIHCLSDSFKIHNYSTRVEGLLKFKATKVKPSTIYLGCELEFETENRNKAQIDVGKLLHEHALMKSDGSIRNGFEIVTCPATLDIHLDVFKKFYDNIPKDLKNASNVGMHVHISRKPLSQLTIGKMTAFLNNLNNKDFIKHIAGRIDNTYAKMDRNRNLTYAWKYRRHGGGDRYNALNLNNQNTIEIRLFATPMDYKTFATRLQFCQALVDYCSPASNNIELKQQSDYKSFVGWLSNNRKIYPELSNHLKGTI